MSEAWANFLTESIYLDLKQWTVFGPANFVMFMYIPAKYRVIWSCCCSFCWNVTLSACTDHHHTVKHLGIVSPVRTRFDRFGGNLNEPIGEFVGMMDSFGGFDS